MKTKINSSKTWVSCSFAILTALILSVGSYWSEPAFGEEGEVVIVSNVEELYAEVNNPNNAGATIRLAPGIYKLSLLDSNGVARPNQGRLILPFGTSLEGYNTYVDHDGDGVWDPRDDDEDGVPDLDAEGRKIFADPATATVIDATDLIVPLNTGGFIVVNSVSNSTVTTFQSIKKLTLWGNHTPRAGIIVQAAQNSSLNMTLVNCTVGLLSRGMQIDARRAPINGNNSTLDVTLEGNVFCYNNPPESQFRQAIQSSVARVDNHKTHLKIRNNRIFDSRVNLLVDCFGPQNSQQIVESENNIYEEAQLRSDISNAELHSEGIQLGMVSTRIPATGAPDLTTGNLIEFNSRGDRIWNNGSSFDEEGFLEGGGLRATFLRQFEGAEFHNNEIKIELKDPLFIKLNADGSFDGPQNRELTETNVVRRRDIKVVGLSGVEALPELTSGNRISIEVKGAISSLTPTDYDSAPDSLLIVDNALPGQVDITIDGSPEDFLNENTGLNLPDVSLFESQGGKGKK